MADEELAATLGHPDVDIQVVQSGGKDVGILELDFRVAGQCELTFMGLTAECTGKGLGRALMSRAVSLAWARPITRMWVHTCTYDHPSALGFYMKAGFKPMRCGWRFKSTRASPATCRLARPRRCPSSLDLPAGAPASPRPTGDAGPPVRRASA